MSRGQFQRRGESWKRAIERCKSKGKTNEVIDVDSDRIPDFVIIDPPDPSGWTSLDTWISGKDKVPVYRNFICIDDDDDDDDDDDESGDCVGPQNYYGESRTEDPYFSSANKSQDAHNQGGKSFSKSSNNGATCSRKISSINPKRFTPSALSENDDSGCDIVEDYLGNIRQQWEKASLRRKTFVNVPKGQSGTQDKFCAMGFNTYSWTNVEIDKTDKVSTGSSITDHKKSNLSPSACTDDGVVADTSNKSDGENHYADLQEAIQQKICHRTSVCNTQAVNEIATRPISNTPPEVKWNPLTLVSNGVGPSDSQKHIIGDREMFKTTDTYKRAEEEEWTLRRKELQIQADEATRLRKRKKAERLRLLEMERRQKRRVEEVRETQIKDEETSSVKEQLRVEVRRELDQLEANCGDMASLLRGLGITVEGGFYPLPSEVRAAYKRAQFKFHPDRSARSDIQQQIEAEEKFKLISHAKEKFML